MPRSKIPSVADTPATDEVIEVRVVGFSADGDPLAVPLSEDVQNLYPHVALESRINVAVGDELRVRVELLGDGTYFGHHQDIQKKKKNKQPPLMGLYRGEDQRFFPLNKEYAKVDYVLPSPPKGLKDGAVVTVRPMQQKRGYMETELVAVIADSPYGMESAIALHNHGIPDVFPDEVLAQSEQLPAFAGETGREDLRSLPIVTIDGADAKDFDDAVWAEPWAQGGKNAWHIIVAIADVAYYVQPGSPLDNEARKRGNSTYLPDMVVPMLPERLSNDLCSLRPHEDRPVLVVHLYIDAQGSLQEYRFTRAVIHSHARLTYEQVQAAFDGNTDETTASLMNATLQPLLKAYKVLLAAREQRGAFDVDIPETRVDFDEQGQLRGLVQRARLDAHRLIEEIMILANVAAATALQTRGAGCLYRIHPPPSDEKINALRELLNQMGIAAKVNTDISPKQFQQIAEKVKAHPEADVFTMMLLRAQAQALYDPENIGHFGLALQRYAHFTSPIRRYSDLVVHRSLINALTLAGSGGAAPPRNTLKNVAQHLSLTERRSQLAEWEARDRITVRFYKDFVGHKFIARVASVQRYGVYVAIADGVAEGLLPCRLMHDDHYRYDGRKGSLKGSRTGKTIALGSKLAVQLHEADPLTGRLTFALEGGSGETRAQRSRARNLRRKSQTPKPGAVKSRDKKDKKRRKRRS